MLDDLIELLDRAQERRKDLEEVVEEAIATRKPVLFGVWGPTGQRIFIAVEP